MLRAVLIGMAAIVVPATCDAADIAAGKAVFQRCLNLGRFLRDPSKGGPGSRMAFPGIKDEKALADLLAYLHQAAQ